MLLKSLKIRNFKNIKELVIDFSSNGADSENAIKSRSFIKIQSGRVLPKISTLIGVNAVGKSNILDSFKFFEKFAFNLNESVANSLVMLKNRGNIDFSEKNLRDETVKLLDEIKNKDSEKFIDFFEHKKEYISRKYLKYSNNDTEPIIIEQVFASGSKEETISLTLDDSSAEVKGMSEYFSKNYMVSYFNELNLTFSFMPSVQMKLEKKLLAIGGENEEKLLKLIQVADPSITGIIHKGKRIYFTNDNSEKEISFINLSSGTKRFLLIAEFIISSIKKSKIILLDEIEPFMHRELAGSIVDLMNILSREFDDRTIIFTTHNPLIIGGVIKYRQVHEISFDHSTFKHESRKLSSLFKQHQNIEKQYKEGRICSFPSSAFAYDFIWEVANEE